MTVLARESHLPRHRRTVELALHGEQVTVTVLARESHLPRHRRTVELALHGEQEA